MKTEPLNFLAKDPLNLIGLTIQPQFLVWSVQATVMEHYDLSDLNDKHSLFIILKVGKPRSESHHGQALGEGYFCCLHGCLLNASSSG